MNEQKYTSYDLYKHILNNISKKYQFQKNKRFEILIEQDEGAENKETIIDFKNKGKIILPFDPESFKKQKEDFEIFPIFTEEKSFPDYIIIPEPQDEKTLFILHVELKSDKYNKQKYIYKFINSGKTLKWISEIMINDLAKKENSNDFNFELFTNIKIIHRFIIFDSKKVSKRKVGQNESRFYDYKNISNLKIPFLAVGKRV
ncbi:hypothetical protein [Geotoga petraea]|uniref:Uncharacterized protein n=1 Tax=Geotoga petraea TaxID=28234 RepID=A0A1G6Q9E7_9BACT|nr:hypothetical protein [Geotoga petraea]SDC88316.1 hypothetical protein SAMN04488588_1994 [Geotoga petraea]